MCFIVIIARTINTTTSIPTTTTTNVTMTTITMASITNMISSNTNSTGTTTTASMLYSNNLTTFMCSLVKDGEVALSEDDDILVGAPEGSDFHVPGMGGVLICKDGEVHPKQTRLLEVIA